MNSFEKQKTKCACFPHQKKIQNLTGLLPFQNQHQKNQYSSHKQRNIKNQQKKLSLKTRNNSSKQTPNRLSNDKQIIHNPNKRELFTTQLNYIKAPGKETRGWMEKKKSQIEIQSIGRVPTKQVFEKTQNPQIKIPIELFGEKTKGEQKKSQNANKPGISSDQKRYSHKHSTSLPAHSQPKGRLSLKLANKKDIYPKEIESIINECSWQQDQISEVIGHGWQNFFEVQGKSDENYPTNTLVTSTTNVNEKNSDIKNSLNKF